MFQSTLLKRTMTLVVVSLLASALLATIAFIVAGKTATNTIEVENSLRQDEQYMNILNSHPEYFESVDLRLFFFDSSYASGHDYYLVNSNGYIIDSTSIEHRSLSVKDTQDILTSLGSLSYEDYNGLKWAIKDYLTIDQMILVTSMPLTIEGEPYTLYSISYLNGYNDLVVKYLNILLLSTLMAAALMLVPAYAFVSRMVLPLQEINEIAMEYGLTLLPEIHASYEEKTYRLLAEKG